MRTPYGEKGVKQMPVRDKVIQFIAKQQALPIPITETTHLYQDLYMDSLSFVLLLLDLEEYFHITITIQEMERCLAVGELIALVKKKVEEKA